MNPRATERVLLWSSVLAATLVCVLSLACLSPREDRTPDGRVILQYWEKWVGFEAESMQEIVSGFNASQSRWWVEYVSVSQIERKLLVAISGGNPPDVAGFMSPHFIQFIERSAAMPLDRRMLASGLSTEAFLPAAMRACQHRGFTWGLPTVVSTIGLVYNRALFREAGLDPDRPPRTIAELDDFARRLTVRGDEGRLTRLGFSPMIPNWWPSMWCHWFGGDLWDGDSRITADSPANLAAFTWIRDFARSHGPRDLQRFSSAQGAFDSAQNPFIAGTLAMTLQGTWIHNFVERYNPTLDWAATPFPGVDENLRDVTVLESDLLFIPKGSPHPDGAWEFMQFVARQESLEALAIGQKKISPLRDVSEDFYARHPNPQIAVFRRLAESPNAHLAPRTPLFAEYNEWMQSALEEVFLQRREPAEALAGVQAHMQRQLDRARRQWGRVEQARLEEWSQE